MEETRRSQLAVLSKRIEDANDKINECLKKLGWERTELLQWSAERSQLSTCLTNKSHRVPNHSLERHSNVCLLRSKGFDINRPKNKRRKKYRNQLSSSLFFYEKSTLVTSFIDPATASAPIPESKKRVVDTTLLGKSSTKSAPELYDNIVARSKEMHTTEVIPVALDQKRPKSSTNSTLKAALGKRPNEADDVRTSKRRPKQQRRRLKNSMSQTEVQRELINGLMEEMTSTTSPGRDKLG